MAAFLIATSKIKDPAKMQEYAAAAGPTFAAFEGQPMARGAVKEVLAGSSNAEIAVVVKFPSAEKAHAWYNSDAYQSCIALRDQAIDPTFLVIEEPPQ